MIFDGMNFRKNKKVVPLPKEYWLGDIKNHITFGVICNKMEDGAIRTNWTYGEDCSPVYAKPIPCKGHSLTNMMYGSNKLYLLYNAEVYVYSLKKKVD